MQDPEMPGVRGAFFHRIRKRQMKTPEIEVAGRAHNFAETLYNASLRAYRANRTEFLREIARMAYFEVEGTNDDLANIDEGLDYIHVMDKDIVG